jgi:hypothetical protein
MELAVIVTSRSYVKSDSLSDSVYRSCYGASANQTIDFVVFAATPWPEALFVRGRRF